MRTTRPLPPTTTEITQVGGLITGDQSAEISARQLAPGNDLESAIIADLAPGSYTAVVRGAANTIGTGVVDAYDLSGLSPARLANIKTRGLVQAGDKLMIAGFIVQNGPVKAVIRAIGPSLSAFGITSALADTTLQLRDVNGAIVGENDNWKTDQKAGAGGHRPATDRRPRSSAGRNDPAWSIHRAGTRQAGVDRHRRRPGLLPPVAGSRITGAR